MPAHAYVIRGKPYTSVTRINNQLRKPGLERWFKTTSAEEIEDAQDGGREMGNGVHQHGRRLALVYPERYEPVSPVTPEIAKMLDDISALLQHLSARIIGAEMVCDSDQHDYAGTYDLVIELENRDLAVVEYKTTRQRVITAEMQREWGRQLAAYMLALLEHAMPIKHRLAFVLRPDAPSEILWYRKETETALICKFLHLAGLLAPEPSPLCERVDLRQPAVSTQASLFDEPAEPVHSVMAGDGIL
jgi:PD-(D/E)XK nuclease superfamily